MNDLTSVAAPQMRPDDPRFSSGPCSKRPGWDLQNLKDAPLGRSHRAAPGKAKLAQAIELTRDVLARAGRLPYRHRTGIGYRRLRNGDVDDARGATSHDGCLGELWLRLGDGRRQAAWYRSRNS